MNESYADNVLRLKALADETRLKIVTMLCKGELCGCKILEHFQITQPTLSYHMRILSDSGLVTARRDGAWMRYSLHMESFQALSCLFADIASSDATGACDSNC